MAIGIALLGSGIFAREEHLPAIRASKDLTLKAVYSRSLASAQSLSTNTDTDTDTETVDLYSDDSPPTNKRNLNDLLSRTDIHAVIIALPIKNQPDYVRRALAAGKHVLSEKPVAENIEEARGLIEWYEKEVLPRGVTWGVAENVRFWEGVVYVGEERRRMGRALTFRARMQALVQEGGKYFETE